MRNIWVISHPAGRRAAGRPRAT